MGTHSGSKNCIYLVLNLMESFLSVVLCRLKFADRRTFTAVQTDGRTDKHFPTHTPIEPEKKFY